MGDKDEKPVAQVAPRPVTVADDEFPKGAFLLMVKPFWLGMSVAPLRKIGPPPPDATVDSPYLDTRLPALTVEEQFRFLYNQMGFTNSLPGAPKTDPKGVGTGVGPAAAPGFNVYAAIQAIDAEGRQVSLGYGAYLGGGGAHGEEIAMQELRSTLSKAEKLQGGRLRITVTQCPCGPDRHHCAGQLEAFAKRFGMEAEVFVPVRDAANPNAKKQVGPSTAARGAHRMDRPPIRFRQVSGPPPMVTTASSSPPGRTRAEVGQPDMSGLNVGGPSAKGVNRVNTMVAGLFAAQFILSTVNDNLQKRNLKRDLERVARETRRHRAENPGEGILLVMYCSQEEGHPDSIIQPGIRFVTIEYHFAPTREEALEKWSYGPAIRQGFPRGTRVITQTAWIQPGDEF